MEKTWEGTICYWSDSKAGAEMGNPPVCPGVAHILFPSGVDLTMLVGKVVEMRVKEPEPHICGAYRVEWCQGAWVATAPETFGGLPRHMTSGSMIVHCCPNCGKKLE